MFQITTLYRCIYANFTMIPLLLASQKLATFTSSYTATITGQICKDLFVGMYITVMYVNKIKIFNSKNKEFCNHFQYPSSVGKTLALTL